MRIARARRDDGADAKDEDGAEDGEKRSRADGGGLVPGHRDRP